MKKSLLALPALAVGSSFAAEGGSADMTSALTEVSTNLNTVAGSLSDIQTAVIAVAVGIAAIVIARACIKKFLKI